MTTPQGRPPEEDRPSVPVPKPDTADSEDESALVPALLVIYAAYLLFRGSHDRVGLGWRQVMAALRLPELIGNQLAMVAARAMARQRDQAGRAGDELWQFTDAGFRAGVDAGYRAIAEALLWTDRAADGDPATKDAGGNVPTGAEPPDILAGLVAQAVMNATMVGVAAAAGWHRKVWRTRRDNRVRDAHVSMEGQVQGLLEPFIAPGGAKLRYPGDPTAPIELVINCRCWVTPLRR
jgi:hypothetical protein